METHINELIKYNNLIIGINDYIIAIYNTMDPIKELIKVF